MFNSGNSTPFTMPVTPAYGNGGGMGGWNSDWVALAILALSSVMAGEWAAWAVWVCSYRLCL